MADENRPFIPMELYVLRCTNSSNTKTYGAVSLTNDGLKVKRAFPMRQNISQLIEDIVMDLATKMPIPEVYHTISYKIPDRFPETLIYKGTTFDFEEMSLEEKNEFRTGLRKSINEAEITSFFKNK